MSNRKSSSPRDHVNHKKFCKYIIGQNVGSDDLSQFVQNHIQCDEDLSCIFDANCLQCPSSRQHSSICSRIHVNVFRFLFPTRIISFRLTMKRICELRMFKERFYRSKWINDPNAPALLKCNYQSICILSFYVIWNFKAF